MRRKRKITKYVEPDMIHNSQLVSRLINQLLRKGKKNTAKKIVYGAFDLIKEKTQKEPLEIFDLAMKNVSPLLEVKSRRVGGANYQVPQEVRGDRKITLALRWIIGAAKQRKGVPMKEKLAAELMDAANNVGSAIKKRQDTHRMAEANRAFAHFSW